MNEIFNTSLFALLSEHSQEVTNQEMQSAYGDFVEHIQAMSNSDDKTTTYRNLNITRIEFASLEPIHRYEQGGKCA